MAAEFGPSSLETWHDDVIKWEHFPHYWPFVRGIHRSIPANSPHKGRPVSRSFDVFFDPHPNKRLSKQWWCWWFETPSCPLWRRRNGCFRLSVQEGFSLKCCICKQPLVPSAECNIPCLFSRKIYWCCFETSSVEMNGALFMYCGIGMSLCNFNFVPCSMHSHDKIQ